MTTKISLVGMNSKFIHSNLAIRYLKKYCEKYVNNIQLFEFNINDSYENILKKLYKSESKIFAFSCYIWNIEHILRLCKSIKMMITDSTIILGGPEVSYDPQNIMRKYECIDFIISGEGEETFLELIQNLLNSQTDFSIINGISYRKDNKVIVNVKREQIQNLDTIPFPYENEYLPENRIIYYETSRGCPFNCQYCLSSTIKGVRFFSLDRIKEDIDFFIRNEIKQVKLVDRTFNCNREHCNNIIEHIVSKNSKTNFHLEVSADIIDDSTLDLLKKAPIGMFQLEIGIQTTNKTTLNEIQRVSDIEKVLNNIKKLIALKNMHIHVDLIAGLPYEDLSSFMESFNRAYVLNAHMLQLGFLKLLKGSGIRNKSKMYNIKYHEHTPYEVISTDWIDYNDITLLKDIEKLIEIYYNSGKFKYTLNYIINNYYTNPFDFYLQFSKYCNKIDFYDSPKGVEEIYNALYNYFVSYHNYDLIFNEFIKYDFLINNKNQNIPEKILRFNKSSLKALISDYLKNDANINKLLPEFLHMTIKDIIKSINYEVFKYNVIDNLAIDYELIIFFIYNKNTFSYTKSIKIDELITD